jgi:hypothetical protein
MFLLKGHEDLRQDERVMQLFGLVNTLLLHDPDTFRRNLTIQVSHVLFLFYVCFVLFCFVFAILTEICRYSVVYEQWPYWLGASLRHSAHVN